MMTRAAADTARPWATWITPGLLWFLVATFGAALFFRPGLDALFTAWALPEYSHGPLIPILSALLFLRQLKSCPVDPGPKRNRWVGVTHPSNELILLMIVSLIVWNGLPLNIRHDQDLVGGLGKGSREEYVRVGENLFEFDQVFFLFGEVYLIPQHLLQRAFVNGDFKYLWEYG